MAKTGPEKQPNQEQLWQPQQPLSQNPSGQQPNQAQSSQEQQPPLKSLPQTFEETEEYKKFEEKKAALAKEINRIKTVLAPLVSVALLTLNIWFAVALIGYVVVMNIRKEEQLKEIVAHQDVARKNFDQEVKQRQEYEKQQGIIQGYEQTIQELRQYKQKLETKTQGESLDQTRDQSEKKAPSPGPVPQLNPSAQGILNNPQITQLQNELKLLRKDYTAQAEKYNQQFIERSEEYKAQLADVKEKFAKYLAQQEQKHAEKMEKIQAELKNHHQEAAKLRETVEKHRKEVEAQKEEHKTHLAQQEQKHTEKMKKLRAELEGHRREAEGRNKRVENLETQVAEGDKEIKSLKEETAALKKEHTNETGKLRTELEAHRKEVEAKKEERKAQAEKHRQEVAEYKKQLADTKAALEEQRQKIVNFEEQAAIRNGQVAEQAQKIRDLEQQQKDAGIKKGDDPGPGVPPNEGGHPNVEDRKLQAEKEPVVPQNVQGDEPEYPNTEPDIKEKENGKEKQQFAAALQDEISLKINQHAGDEHDVASSEENEQKFAEPNAEGVRPELSLSQYGPEAVELDTEPGQESPQVQSKVPENNQAQLKQQESIKQATFEEPLGVKNLVNEKKVRPRLGPTLPKNELRKSAEVLPTTNDIKHSLIKASKQPTTIELVSPLRSTGKGISGRA